jgi:hypothetical protein
MTRTPGSLSESLSLITARSISNVPTFIMPTVKVEAKENAEGRVRVPGGALYRDLFSCQYWYSNGHSSLRQFVSARIRSLKAFLRSSAPAGTSPDCHA